MIQTTPGQRLGMLLLQVPAREADPEMAQILGAWQAQLAEQFEIAVMQVNALIETRVRQLLDHIRACGFEEAYLVVDNVKHLLFQSLNSLVVLATNNQSAFLSFCSHASRCRNSIPDLEERIALLKEYDLLSGVSIHFARMLDNLDAASLHDILDAVIFHFVRREFERRRTPDLVAIEHELCILKAQACELLARVNDLESRPYSPPVIPPIPRPEGEAYQPITFEEE